MSAYWNRSVTSPRPGLGIVDGVGKLCLKGGGEATCVNVHCFRGQRSGGAGTPFDAAKERCDVTT